MVSQCVESGKFALSFDDGPSGAVTDSLIDTIQGMPGNIPLSFFLVGQQVSSFNTQINREVNAGYATYSHTYTHQSLVGLAAADVYTEMATTMQAFVNSGVCRRPTLMRPPYGDTDAAVEALLGRMGYRGVLWNLDTLDWQYAATNPSKVVTDFTSGLKALGTVGVVSLEHDLVDETVAVAPQVRGNAAPASDLSLWSVGCTA
jgi:peptidoglycan/xylan/chitin deacetylase (PgdA/CDA1 family)